MVSGLKTGKPFQVLVDADMFIYRACSACETEVDWGNGFCTLHVELVDAENTVDETVASAVEAALKAVNYKGFYETVMCLSDSENFRKHLLPTYKANRKGTRKPLGYWKVVEWVKENYNTVQKPSLEADDCVGILATLNPGNHVMISGDKDFRSIPGYFYDFMSGVLYTNSPEEADYRHLWQTLVGDTADNYKGCPSIGETRATRLLKEKCDWKTVEDLFVSKGLTKEDALLQARVARILRCADYDFKKKKPILWCPPGEDK